MAPDCIGEEVEKIARNLAPGEVLLIENLRFYPAEEKPEKWRPWLFNTPLNYFVPGAMRPSNEELWYLKKDLVSLKQDFSRITCPVYFIHGAMDTWVPPSNVEYGKSLLVNSPKVEETLIPGANHFNPWTKFKEIRSILLKLY